MEVPSILFGTDKQVRKHCTPIIKLITRGKSLTDSLLSIPVIETKQEMTSLFLLANPGRPISEQNHYIFYLFQFLIIEKIIKGIIPKEREQELFEEFLTTPWSVLGLMCMPIGSAWTLGHEDRHWDLLDAFSMYWDLFLSVGKRYSSNLVSGGSNVYEVPSYLGPTLAYCGVPESLIQAHLFEEGIMPLMKYVRK